MEHRGISTVCGIGPALGYIAAYLTTPFFGLFVGLSWFAALQLRLNTASRGFVALFAFSSIVMSLIRPEGVFLVGFMLLALILYSGWKRMWTVVWTVTLTFAVIGGLCFAWHWDYFGYPLPNPFYKKGGGNLCPWSLVHAFGNLFLLGGPFLALVVLGFRSRQSARSTIFALLPLCGFTAIWILLSDEMNYLERFQCACVPILLMSWPLFPEGIDTEWRLPSIRDLDRRNRWVMATFFVFLSCGILAYQHRASVGRNLRLDMDGRLDAALVLRSLSNKHYALVTTEEGLIPPYSGWRTIDAWGLNDPFIAHHSGITQKLTPSQSY